MVPVTSIFFRYILWYRGVYRTKYCKISSHRGLYWLKCCQFSSPSGQLFWRWFKHTKKYYEYKSVTNKNHCQPQLPEYVICKKKCCRHVHGFLIFLLRATTFFLRMISAEKKWSVAPTKIRLLPHLLGCSHIYYLQYSVAPTSEFGCSLKSNC